MVHRCNVFAKKLLYSETDEVSLTLQYRFQTFIKSKESVQHNLQYNYFMQFKNKYIGQLFRKSARNTEVLLDFSIESLVQIGSDNVIITHHD